MVVYFIRHGETDFNKRCLIQGMSDIPLNDKGIHQAELAADWFKQQGIVFDVHLPVHLPCLRSSPHQGLLITELELQHLQLHN